MKQSANARSLATQVLTQVIGQKRSLSDCLDSHLNTLTDPRERALAQALCYGVLRWLPRLQAIVDHLLDKPLKAKEGDIQVLLYIGLYQLLYLRIPPYAATAATVQVARMLQKNWATALVNAILRRFQRQRETLLTTVDAKPVSRWSHPAWWLKHLKAQWPQQWQTIIEANNAHPPLTLRINTRWLSRERYLEHLKAAQIAAAPLTITEEGVVLDEPVDVACLPGFDQGWISVQDGAAQLAATLLEIPEQAWVLDACAAPGGKAAHLLERYDIAALWALDKQPARVAKLAATLKRLRLTAQLHCADASQPNMWWTGQLFDRILLDAPCSGSGVIRRHPDIKYLRQPQDLVTLSAQQTQLLDALWPLLKPTGHLLYVTCSVFAEENQLQIAQFLARHADAYEKVLDVSWGQALAKGRQILPGEDNLDGFYYACLIKTA